MTLPVKWVPLFGLNVLWEIKLPPSDIPDQAFFFFFFSNFQTVQIEQHLKGNKTVVPEINILPNESFFFSPPKYYMIWETDYAFYKLST